MPLKRNGAQHEQNEQNKRLTDWLHQGEMEMARRLIRS